MAKKTKAAAPATPTSAIPAPKKSLFKSPDAAQKAKEALPLRKRPASPTPEEIAAAEDDLDRSSDGPALPYLTWWADVQKAMDAQIEDLEHEEIESALNMANIAELHRDGTSAIKAADLILDELGYG